MLKFYFKILLLFLSLSLLGCVKDDKGIIISFYNFPNPFHPKTESTKFRAVFDTTGISAFSWKLVIYAEDSSTVYEANGEVSVVSSPFDIVWTGRDNRGNVVKNGIYRSYLTIKITKTTLEYSGDTYVTDCYTVVK